MTDQPDRSALPQVVFHPVQTHNVKHTIRESVVLRAYEVYCHVNGPQRRGCRGGFSANELIAFLYAYPFPRNEWARRVDEALESK